MKNLKCLLSLTLLLLFAIEVSATPPTPPSGKKWEKIQNMSDEFDGSSLDLSKWAKSDPQWEGRKPARFEESSISVTGGELRITGSKKSNPYSGWTHNGGLVRSLNKATYGYYETRMKANKTFLSSTFWLFNKRNEGSGCDVRTTELDITETVGWNTGGHGWIENNMKRMNSNSHSRGTTCSSTPVGTEGGNAALGEYAYQGYHTYAVWWKSKDELLFYLDDVYKFTVTPPADFNLGMYLRMVVESYDWNPPKNGNDGINGTFANRTTYYEWTRSWKLVNCSGGNCGPDNPPSVSFTSPSNNQNFNAGATVNVTVNASDDGSVSNVKLYLDNILVRQENTAPYNWGANDAALQNMAAGTYTLKAVATDNTGKTAESSITIVVGTAPQCSLPVTKPNFSISNTTENWSSGVIDISCESSVKISMDLEGVGSMETSDYLNVYYKVNGGAQQVISENTDDFPKKTVSKTGISGNTVEIIINGKTSVGTETYNITNIKVEKEGTSTTESVSCSSLPSTIESQTSYTFQIPYVAATTRDVTVEFWEAGAWKKNAKTSVNAGSGTASVTVNLGAAPANGASVLLKVAIRPTGTTYNENIDACEETMTVSGTTPTCDVPYSGPNYSVSKTTNNWSSGTIDISCASSVNISMTAAGVGPMENSDYLNIYYKVNGGSQVTISENTNSFASKTVSANGISGNTLELIINGKTSWQDETYTVTNISVVDPTKSAQESIASQDIQRPELTLFPNPASDILYLKLSSKLEADAKLHLYNNAGSLIQTQQLTNNNPSLELSNLSQGMYVIMLINGNDIITEKFIKQ